MLRSYLDDGVLLLVWPSPGSGCAGARVRGAAAVRGSVLVRPVRLGVRMTRLVRFRVDSPKIGSQATGKARLDQRLADSAHRNRDRDCGRLKLAGPGALSLVGPGALSLVGPGALSLA